MKVIFTCGGTGGHIYPAIAMYNEFKKHDANNTNEYLFVGSDYGLEKEIFAKEDITDVQLIKSRGLRRKIALSNFKSIYYNVIALFQAKKIISGFTPDIVISTGGYTSFHITLLALKRKIPVFLIESNVKPGLVTRLFYKKAAKVFVDSELSKEYLRKSANVKVFGTPSRIIKTEKSKQQIIESLGLDIKEKTVTIIGGSCGATEINDVVGKLIKNCSIKYQVIWATGKHSYESIVSSISDVPDKVKIIDYIAKMNEILKITDLIVSRSGAMSIQEIKEFQIPAILIPFDKATGNHQYLNALTLKTMGVAEIIKEQDIDENVLNEMITQILFDEERLLNIRKEYAKMESKNSNEMIYNEIMK